MKLIILDELALKSYELPSSQKTFNINYRNEIITVNKQNDKWFLSSSKNMDISLNGQLVDKVELNDYTIFTIHHKVVNKEVTVIASPGIDKYSVCSITELSEVTIGMSNNATIQYGDGLIKDPHASIKIANDTGVITAAENALVYVNNKAIKSQTLKLGDVIFIYGLRIIWMGNFIKVNNPSNKVTLNGLQASNLVFQEADKYTKVTESERNTKLYDESQLFFHTPTQSTFIKNVDIHIETPPDKEKYESLPIIFTLGTSMVVAASAGMSGINAVRNMMAGEGDKLTNYLEIGIAGLMLFSCIFMPILLDLYQKHVSNKKERLRQKRYKKYLETKKNEIDLAIKSQSNILNDKHLPIDKVEKQMLSKGYAFWSREIIDPDFLSVRLGVGNVPASLHVGANLEEFNLYDDNLKDMVADMVNKNYELPNVPISISLLNNRITPIVNETNKVYEYINTIMLQLLFYYSSIDLKIVLITKEENKDVEEK
jgi:S-DNA-T family DNA segregation ATPase FtsK/SpoIIIE